MRRFLLFLLPLWIAALACTETNPVEPERSGSLHPSYTVRSLPPLADAGAQGDAFAKAISRTSGVLPTIDVNGTNDAETGAGSASVSQAGAGKRSSVASAMPTALRWSSTHLYVTYNGATRPYRFNATENDLVGGLQGELATLEAGGSPGKDCTACLFARDWATADEAAAYLRAQGMTAEAMDHDRLEVDMPFAGRSMEQRTVARLILNLRERRLERSTMLIDGQETSSHAWSETAPAGFPASDTFTLQGAPR